MYIFWVVLIVVVIIVIVSYISGRESLIAEFERLKRLEIQWKDWYKLRDDRILEISNMKSNITKEIQNEARCLNNEFLAAHITNNIDYEYILKFLDRNKREYMFELIERATIKQEIYAQYEEELDKQVMKNTKKDLLDSAQMVIEMDKEFKYKLLLEKDKLEREYTRKLKKEKDAHARIIKDLL